MSFHDWKIILGIIKKSKNNNTLIFLTYPIFDKHLLATENIAIKANH